VRKVKNLYIYVWEQIARGCKLDEESASGEWRCYICFADLNETVCTKLKPGEGSATHEQRSLDEEEFMILWSCDQRCSHGTSLDVINIEPIFLK
jgi:hypothetical protein